MSKHTPTPWEKCEAGDYSDYDGDSIILLGDDISCRVAAVFGADEKAEANAEFIVRAVNAHDALVTALKLLVRNGQKQGWTDKYQDDMNAALAAISKAEGADHG